jgi:TolB-like protein
MLAAMIYRFDRFELDLATAELRANGERCPLQPQVFALLAILVENSERLVSRDEILEKVWDGRVVTNSALSSRVKSARQVLGDDGKAQRFIRTIHGQGFRFVAQVRVEHPVPRRAAITAVGAEPPVQPGSPAPGVAEGSQPSIAVLPFRFLGDVCPYATIADAIPHELITELARLRWLFVTARGSSFRLRGPNVDAREVGRLLDVRYCLTGSVEVTNRQLAITTELACTSDCSIVWAERYTGRIDDVHAVREDIRSRILSAVELQIPMHEAVRARLLVTEDLDAWSAYHLGLQHMYRFNRSDNEAAARLFGRAVALDPGFARAHAGLSFTHFQTAFMRQSDDIAGETALARSLAERGLELDPLDPFVNFTMGRSLWLEGDLEGGLTWLERATALCPNYAQGLYSRALMETLAGRGLDGRGHVDLALRLSPLDPLFYAMLGARAFTHMAEGEDSEAASWAQRAARSPGAHVFMAMIAAVAHALAGNGGLAHSWAANVRERNPALTRADFFRAFPIRPEAMRSRVSAALVNLGI